VQRVEESQTQQQEKEGKEGPGIQQGPTKPVRQQGGYVIMATLNKYIITFSDNGEKFEVEAESLVALKPLIQNFTNQGRGCKVSRAVENKAVEEPTTKKEKEMEKFIIAGTGSRELILDMDKRRKVRDYLAGLLTQAKEKHGDKLIVISGMAEGFDEALARAAIMTDVPFTAAIPSSGYIKHYWGKTSLLKRDRMAEAEEILSKALEIVYVCPGIYGPDGRHSNFHRNEWMVDHADIVWVYNPTTRGTAQCYAYCKKIGKKTYIIDINKEVKQ